MEQLCQGFLKKAERDSGESHEFVSAHICTYIYIYTHTHTHV